MRSHFLLLFWGLAVAHFNFHVNGIPLLPDVIGYAMIAFACGKLNSASAEFSVARWLAFCSIAIWIMGFFVPANYAYFQGLSEQALGCTLIWKLLTGIHEYAEAHYQLDIAEKALWRRKAYVISVAVAWVLSTLSGGIMGNVNGAFGTLVWIASLVFFFLVMHIVFKGRLIGSAAKKFAHT